MGLGWNLEFRIGRLWKCLYIKNYRNASEDTRTRNFYSNNDKDNSIISWQTIKDGMLFGEEE